MRVLIGCLILALAFILIKAKNNQNHKTNQKWKNHMNGHGLRFKKVDQEKEAYANFEESDTFIEEHNNHAKANFKVGHNAFSHLSKKEREKRLGTKSGDFKRLNKRSTTFLYYFIGQNHTFYLYEYTPGYKLKASVDWIKSGWNTTVRNQLQCGSCWAFATTSSIEAAYWIKNKTSVVLSPQQLVDCSRAYNNLGCRGGVVAYAYGYANDVGLVAETNYVYNATNNTCKFGSLATPVKTYKVKQYYKIKDDSALMEVLDKYGPVAVGIDASSFAFSFYQSGIFALFSGYCSTYINHAVLLTGYGTDQYGNPYWTIKNSWGSSWGNGGYMNISRKTLNNCGISSQAFIPIL